jgi:hypothetical protein
MAQKVVVIGAGPGGYVAAIRLAQLGAEVILIEKDKLGGTCLNVGCIPTKVLLHCAEVVTNLGEAQELGVKVDSSSINWDKVQEKRKKISSQLVMGVGSLVKSNKIKLIEGSASFVDKHTLNIVKKDKTEEKLTFDKLIIASGSVPAIPPIPGVKECPACIDSTAALELDKVPKSMLVIGGGVIGIEMATAYSAFGTKVTIVEALPKILPLMDGELSKMLKKSMQEKNIEILTGTKVLSVETTALGAKVNVETEQGNKSFEAEKVLVAVGRRTYTESLDLAAAGIANDKGRITVNDKMQTNVEGIYAIGDCLGKVMLAHVASAQGEVAAENIMGANKQFNGATSPSCVYTDPEFAGVGLTEEQAKEQNKDYEVGRFPLAANGKALIANGGQGVVKVIKGKEYNEILGVHILGPRATDLIAEAALMIGMEATAEDVIETIHAHPTLTEAVREAVLASEGIAIHIPNKKK